MFVAQPHDALQDVMEINFGFEVTSIAGQDVSNEPEPENKEEEKKENVEMNGADDPKP